MTQNALRRIPVLVVSGFLGAGKTTLVRRLLEDAQSRSLRLAIVSNEFGALGIDKFLLGEQHENYVELSGGCVCCQLSDDLLATVQDLYERARPDRLVVETSGIALPSDTLLTFWRDPVRQWVEDDLAIVVVNAEQVHEGSDLEGTFEEQLTSADMILLNKIDLVGARGLASVRQRLRRLEPESPIVEAVQANVDPEILFPPSPAEMRASRSTAVRPHPHRHDEYRARELRIAAGVSAVALVDQLRRLKALRIKGFVRTDDGLRLVQGVGRRIQLTAVEDTMPSAVIGRVVVIERKSSGDPT
jgi:cobalamin biosynthesis protein CobW